MIEAPQSFVVRQECDKATFQNGYRKPLGEQAGWTAYASTTAQGVVHLAASGPQGPWFLALDHSGAIHEFGLAPSDMTGPGIARYAFAKLGELYGALGRVYQLAASLPDAPLHVFEAKTRNLPKTTEAERLIVQRVGQDVFRAALDNYWGGVCAVTGIADRALLRASHAKPWADCTTDAERLDVYNGLLLAAHLDAAFDACLISFEASGKMIFSPGLSDGARRLLDPGDDFRLPLTPQHQVFLDHHRALLAARS